MNCCAVACAMVRLPPRVVGAHAQQHLVAGDGHQALVADGRAVRVARQVVQHRRRSGQRRLGVDHPVVAAQRLHALRAAPASVSAGSRGSAPASIGLLQRLQELAPEHPATARAPGTGSRGERLGSTQAAAPSVPSCSAPQAISACTCRWRRRSCVQVCSTSVKAPMPPSQRGLAANSVSVAAVHCISVS